MEGNLGVPTRHKSFTSQIINIPIQDVERAYQAVSDFTAFLSISGFVSKDARLRLCQGTSGVEGALYNTSGTEFTHLYCCESCSRDEIIWRETVDHNEFKIITRYTITIGAEKNTQGDLLVQIRTHKVFENICHPFTIFINIVFFLIVIITVVYFGVFLFIYIYIFPFIRRGGKIEIQRNRQLEDLQFYFTTYSPAQPSNSEVYTEDIEAGTNQQEKANTGIVDTTSNSPNQKNYDH